MLTQSLRPVETIIANFERLEHRDSAAPVSLGEASEAAHYFIMRNGFSKSIKTTEVTERGAYATAGTSCIEKAMVFFHTVGRRPNTQQGLLLSPIHAIPTALDPLTNDQVYRNGNGFVKTNAEGVFSLPGLTLESRLLAAWRTARHDRGVYAAYEFGEVEPHPVEYSPDYTHRFTAHRAPLAALILVVGVDALTAGQAIIDGEYSETIEEAKTFVPFRASVTPRIGVA